MEKKENKAEYKTAAETEIKVENWNIKRIAELEEENKTLKDNVEFLHSCLDDRDKSIAIMQEENKKLKENIAWYEKEEDRLREENRKLKEEIENHKQNIMQDELEIIPKLEKENKSLKEKLKRKEGIIANLRDDKETLELWLDNKEKLNEEYRKELDYRHTVADVVPEGKGHIAEETIQDLQERIKELKAELDKYKAQYEHSMDDELIYEEGLYD